MISTNTKTYFWVLSLALRSIIDLLLFVRTFYHINPTKPIREGYHNDSNKKKIIQTSYDYTK